MPSRALRKRRQTPVLLPASQKPALQALSQLIQSIALDKRPRCEVVDAHGKRAPVPLVVLTFLADAVELLSRGDAVTVVPTRSELTTQQAADLLNVSRQYLVRLLDEGRLPVTKTGSHRRVRLDDLLRFKSRRDDERRAKLDELSQLSEAYSPPR
jgi:excisionase family DNA binding protein